MVRETKEQREARRQQEELDRLAAQEAHRLSMPARLMKMQADAHSVGVSTEVKLTESGPSVHFTYHDGTFDETISYTTEEWEVEYAERRLREMAEARDAAIARQARAQEVFGALSATDKAAIKEFIYVLR